MSGLDLVSAAVYRIGTGLAGLIRSLSVGSVGEAAPERKASFHCYDLSTFVPWTHCIECF